MTHIKDQDNDTFIKNGLSLSLVLYAITCPISQSANYFPMVFICIIAVYIQLKINKSFSLPYTVKIVFGIWLALIIWQSATLLFNGNGWSLSPLTRALSTLPIILLSGLTGDEQWKKNCAIRGFLALLSVSGTIVILGLFQKAAGFTYPFPRQLFHEGKLYGFFGHYIHAGGFFSTLAVFSLCIVLFWHTSVKRKTFLVILFSVLTAGALFSMSRTYYVSLFMTLPLVFLRKNRKTAFLGISLILSLGLILYNFSPGIRDRAISIIDLKKNPSNIERLYLWKAAMDVIQDHPVAGVGFRQWGNRVPPYLDTYTSEWNFSSASLHHAHNAYLTVASETGLAGLLLFLGFWFYLLYLMFRTARKVSGDTLVVALNLGASFALVNLLIGGMFEDNFGKLLNISLIAFLISLAVFVGNNGNKGYSAIE